MGKFLERIKKMFGISNKLTLPEKGVNSEKTNKSFRNEQQNIQGVKNQYIEYALLEYFQEYQRCLEESKRTGDIPNSYCVLTQINAITGRADLNRHNEETLLSQIKNERRYNIQEQKDSNGEVGFYHIQANGYRTIPDDDMIRIYLNCRDENVAAIVKELLDNNQNPKLYLKFDSTDSMMKRIRNEKMVIYTDEQHLNQDISNIRNVKNKRPELFKDATKMNPFIQQFENCYSVVNQVKGNDYMDLQGKHKYLERSTNTFIAEIIQDSYKEAVQDIAKKDKKIGFLLDEKNKEDYNLYMQNYPYINANYHNELINSMEFNMKILSNNNKVAINGISTDIKKESNIQREGNNR